MDKVVETKNHCVPPVPGCRRGAGTTLLWPAAGAGCVPSEKVTGPRCAGAVWRRAGRSGAAEPAPVSVVSSAGAGGGGGVDRRLDTIYLRSMVTLLCWSAGNFGPIK